MEWGPIDWKECFNSLKINYINIREKEGYTIDVYYHTYESDEIQELEKAYQPKLKDISKFSSKSTQMNSTIKALNLVKETYNNYDEILLIRFDLL